MATEFTLVSNFQGYRNKEDITNMPNNVMIAGSQNVLCNESERVAVRRGYTLDGQSNSTVSGIVASYDWTNHLGYERNLRSWGTDLEYRYVDSSNAVTWRTLSSGFTSVNFNFAEYWDTSENIDVLLFVNGTSNIYEWNGALATFASATVNTITKQGTTTWGEEGFYLSGTKQVVIDGIVYTYTGGESTTTLTGVTPDPTLGGHAVGSVVHQAMRTTANSAMTGIPATFKNTLIAPLLNYIYVGASDSREVYVSKQNDYKNYTFSSPRLPGEGALLTLDGVPNGFIQQEESMYISASTDQWYQTYLQLSADQNNEALFVRRLATTTQQAAQSQAMIAKIKTSVVYISNEPTLDELGRVENVTTPQQTSISDPIKNDFDAYNFTGAHVLYWRTYIFVAVPEDNVVRMYNLVEGFWEAPQTFPISRLAIIGGQIYGHSSQSPETYKLFNGTTDNGAPINAVARFAFDQFGKRANLKNFNEFYVEGYISSNTDLSLNLKMDYYGCGTDNDYTIDGGSTQIVCSAVDDGSLGKQSYGIFSLAGRGTTDFPGDPKFRVIKTFPKRDFYEYSPTFSSNGEDQRWEIICFGSNAVRSTAENVTIKQ